MKIRFNTTHRRKLADEIGVVLGAIPNYQKLPTFAYKIGDCNLDKEGTLHIPDTVDLEIVTKLTNHLKEQGFIGETEQEGKLIISVPKNNFTDLAINNLKQIIENKKILFMKAFDTDSLRVDITKDAISFSWFAYTEEHEEIRAYTEFATKLCEMARNMKRVGVNPTVTDNDKYTFRTFLIRLNLNGDEHKITRRILLKNLTGNSAFRK